VVPGALHRSTRIPDVCTKQSECCCDVTTRAFDKRSMGRRVGHLAAPYRTLAGVLFLGVALALLP